jgi:O-antigen ligase
MVADYPISGAGYGAFASAFPRYQHATPNEAVEFAHNDYLQWLAELGIPGMLVMVALIVVLFAEAWRAALPREGGDPGARRLALACTAALAALLVHSFGDYNLQVPANAMTFAWIAGIAIGIDPRVRFSLPRGGRFSASSSPPREHSVGKTIIYPSSSP